MSVARTSSLPQTDRQFTSGSPASIRSLSRLIRIGFLRSGGWLVIPAMVVFGSVFARSQLVPGVVLWSDLSTRVGATTLFLGPLVMGYAAWCSQSARRARVTELEAMSPTSPLTRDLARILSATLVAVLGQTLLVGVALGFGEMRATWDGPLWWPLILSIATVFAAGAIGGIAGALSPWRLLPPILALICFLWFVAVSSQVFGYELSRSLRMFSPFAVAEQEYVDPFWESQTGGVAKWFTLVVLLTGFAALALLAFRRRRTLSTWVLAAMLCGSTVAAGVVHRDHWRDTERMVIALNAPRPFTYACSSWDEGEICVHPAYVSLIDDMRAEADRVLEPLSHLSGLPTTIRHMAGDVPDDGHTIWVTTRSLSDDWDEHFGNAVIRQVIGLSGANEAFSHLGGSRPTQPDAAQMVIGRWLSSEAGFDPRQLFGPIPPSDMGSGFDRFGEGDAPDAEWVREVNVAVARFAALSPKEQGAWLEANWESLRAGTLTLEDLP